MDSVMASGMAYTTKDFLDALFKKHPLTPNAPQPSITMPAPSPFLPFNGFPPLMPAPRPNPTITPSPSALPMPSPVINTTLPSPNPMPFLPFPMPLTSPMATPAVQSPLSAPVSPLQQLQPFNQCQVTALLALMQSQPNLFPLFKTILPPQQTPSPVSSLTPPSSSGSPTGLTPFANSILPFQYGMLGGGLFTPLNAIQEKRTPPPSRKATQADLMAVDPRPKSRAPRSPTKPVFTRPTDEEKRRLRDMQAMARAVLNGADPQEVLKTCSTSLIPAPSHAQAHVVPEAQKESDAWNVPIRLDPVGAMFLDGLTHPIVVATQAIDKLLIVKMVEALEAVPDFGVVDPTVNAVVGNPVDALGGLEVEAERSYNIYSFPQMPNGAMLVKGGFGEVDDFMKAGVMAPQLNKEEREFNALRKIVLWQAVMLMNRGIVVDTEILRENPPRGMLRRTIQKRLLELKKLYIYYGSTVVILLKTDKRLGEWIEQGHLPKVIVDMQEIQQAAV